MERKNQVDRLQEAQNNLRIRIANIFKLLNYYQPRISDTEQQFFAELDQFDKQTQQLNQRVEKV